MVACVLHLCTPIMRVEKDTWANVSTAIRLVTYLRSQPTALTFAPTALMEVVDGACTSGCLRVFGNFSVPEENPDAVIAVAGLPVSVLSDTSNKDTKRATASVSVICDDDAGHSGTRLTTHQAVILCYLDRWCCSCALRTDSMGDEACTWRFHVWFCRCTSTHPECRDQRAHQKSHKQDRPHLIAMRRLTPRSKTRRATCRCATRTLVRLEGAAARALLCTRHCYLLAEPLRANTKV